MDTKYHIGGEFATNRSKNAAGWRGRFGWFRSEYGVQSTKYGVPSKESQCTVWSAGYGVPDDGYDVGFPFSKRRLAADGHRRAPTERLVVGPSACAAGERPLRPLLNGCRISLLGMNKCSPC